MTEASRSPRDRIQEDMVARRPDAAAAYARGLLRACDVEIDVPDRVHFLSAPREWAHSGAMYLTGEALGPPRFAAGALATAARGAGMALCALAPNSSFDALDAPALLAERAAIAGLARHGSVSAGGSAHLLAARSGRLVVNLPRPSDWQLMPAWLEAADARLEATRDWSSLAELVARKPMDALVDRGRMMGLAVAAARKTIADDHALFTLQHPTQRSIRTPDRPVRLLDLSHLWAGPLATSLLAMAGIEVLKVESPLRPDGAREGPKEFFHLLNQDKRGRTIDLGQPNQRAFFERLLERADIVVESARSRGLAQLGYDAASWVTASPGRIWLSITGHGRAHDWIAFGDDAAIAAGLAWSPDCRESDPCFCGDAIADPLTGLHGAVLVLSHWRDGRGGLLDLALSDCAAHAAGCPVDRLVLPIDSTAHGFRVVESRHHWPIEAPRARNVSGTAPPLVEADEAFVAAWSDAC